ncbi:MAG: lipocalin-like domain-containing protein [Cyclobacteriaceae bacterium]|nr:lipocalin-like domain-containing protein [Cyclobacteriaceae bacterium]
MQQRLSLLFLFMIMVAACSRPSENSAHEPESLSLHGTWRLISGTLVEDGDTTVTDYTRAERMIKIINDSHFAFLRHDLNKGQDSPAIFVAGGGSYTLQGDRYTENLEYCSEREWEGSTFEFTVAIEGDTLIRQGIEKVESLGVERYNIEKYVRVTPN